MDIVHLSPINGGFPPSTLQQEAESSPTQAGAAGNQTGATTSSAPPGPAEQSSFPWPVQGVIEQLTSYWWPTAPSVPDLSPLCIPEPGTLATNPAVLDALLVHAQDAGTELSREAIQKYVALGERVVRAIEQTGAQDSQEEVPLDGAQEAVDATGQSRAGRVQRLKLTTPAGGVELTPNQEVTRAISWYVVACAAQQDANQKATGMARMIDGKEVSDLSISGSYMFKDPGHAIYRFMQSSPLAYSRISTHFNETSASAKDYWGNADQRGIEDYDRRLPGQNGTILFDQLQGDEGQALMFIKFESEGMPHVSTSAQRIDDMGRGSASPAMAWQRVIAHSLSFIRTRLESPPPGVERKEHVYKGILRPVAHDPFMQVVSRAEKLGLLEPEMNSRLHARGSQERGFPHLETILTQVKAKIEGLAERTSEHDDLQAELVQLEAALQLVKAQLGMQSDALDIVRRGAETHVDLSPPRAHWQAQQRSFQHLEGDLAQAQGVLQPYLLSSGDHQIPAGVHAATAQDWRLHGIEINGKAYPGEGRAGWTASGVDGSGSSLEQACSAFVQACGGNLVAADWISRFAQQRLALPLLSYLQEESLGSVGEGIDLSAGLLTLKVNSLPQGAVEVVLDFKYENQEEAPIDVRRVPDDTTLEMDEKARLQASVALRFENLASFTAAQAPVPVISKPLTYSTSYFHEKAGSGFELLTEADFNPELSTPP